MDRIRLKELKPELKTSECEQDFVPGIDEPKAPPTDGLEDLRPVFIKNYGVSMEIPAFYYNDAKFVPHFKDYCVTMSQHIIPKKQKPQIKIQTTYMDSRVEVNSFDEIYEQTG